MHIVFRVSSSVAQYHLEGGWKLLLLLSLKELHRRVRSFGVTTTKTKQFLLLHYWVAMGWEEQSDETRAILFVCFCCIPPQNSKGPSIV